MADNEIIFQFRSRTEYVLVTVIIIMSGLFTFIALSIWQAVGKNCEIVMSSCSVGIHLAAGFVSLIVLSADILTCLTLPWFIQGAFRLIITPEFIDMYANGSKTRLRARDISSYRIDILSYALTLYSGRRPRVDFRNWARGAPEYSSSAIHFDVRVAGRSERYSFPLGNHVFQTPDVQAGLEAALTKIGIVRGA